MNPYEYEVVAVDRVTGRPEWVHLWESALIRPVRQNTERGAVITTGSALLGVACARNGFTVAYFDQVSGRQFYDFFTRTGAPQGRAIFRRGERIFPGFLAARTTRELVTFRTKPFSQVSVYRYSPQ